MWGPARRIEFDDSYFPIVVLDLLQDHEPDVPWMLAQYDRIFAMGRRYAGVGSGVKVTRPMNAAARKQVSDWLVTNKPNMERLCVGVALVFDSALVRGAMTALHWVAPAPMPMFYPATFEQAAQWCLGQLEQAGEAMGPNTRAVLLRAQP
jgi:hypothetical protein